MDSERENRNYSVVMGEPPIPEYRLLLLSTILSHLQNRYYFRWRIWDSHVDVSWVYLNILWTASWKGLVCDARNWPSWCIIFSHARLITASLGRSSSGILEASSQVRLYETWSEICSKLRIGVYVRVYDMILTLNSWNSCGGLLAKIININIINLEMHR